MAGAFGHEGDRLSAFLDDELDEGASLDVTRHLARCPECTAELEHLRTTREALRSLPQATPSLSWMVETAVLVPAGDGARHRIAAAGAVVAATALVVAVTGYALGGETGTVEPPVGQLVVDHVRSVEGGPVVTPVRLDDGTGGP